jgi:phosphoenolpyruvate carboxykinase (ATP)
MTQIFHNLSTEELIDHALRNKEGTLAANGALTVLTGARTGRSPRDKYIVQDEMSIKEVDWGAVNQPMNPDRFERLWQAAEQSLNEHPIYDAELAVGTDPMYQINVNVRCNFAWHTLFCKILFLSREASKESVERDTWTLMNPAFFEPDPTQFNLNGSAAIVLDFNKKRILICGTHYAGEMKKAMFTVMNYQLPSQGVLPMHCSATIDSQGNTTLFFGLSGTGKTTLSADPERRLIGDDEHGWGNRGVFNMEGGCYAKCINLSPENEPLIWHALRHGALMENVVLDPDTRQPDFFDQRFTENTRAAYPIDFIENRVHEPVSAHPTNIVFLTCDLFGVLPPVARLNLEQVEYYFLVGYTALVGSTEYGSTDAIKPTFSRCFGAPFFPRPAQVYADLLCSKIKEYQIPVYLVNTGWHKGAYGMGGERFSIPITRRIIQAINQGELNLTDWRTLPIFNLSVPKSLDGLDSSLLYPSDTWSDSHNYEHQAYYLKELLDKHYHDVMRSNQHVRLAIR